MNEFLYLMGGVIYIVGYLIAESLMSPIRLCSGIWDLPVYVTVAFFLWVFGTLGCIVIAGEKKFFRCIVTVLVLLLLFTYVYAIGCGMEGYVDNPEIILLTPTLCMPVLCGIGLVILFFRVYRRKKRMKFWATCLNYIFREKIEGCDTIVNLIEGACSDEKQMEDILCLLDACSGKDLRQCFGRKQLDSHKDLLEKIVYFISRYGIEAGTEGKTLGEIRDELLRLRGGYEGRIYDLGQIGIEAYGAIKGEYDSVVKKGQLSWGKV